MKVLYFIGFKIVELGGMAFVLYLLALFGDYIARNDCDIIEQELHTATCEKPFWSWGGFFSRVGNGFIVTFCIVAALAILCLVGSLVYLWITWNISIIS